MSVEPKSLYDRLGGYEAITAVANDLLPRLRADPQLGRFWAHRGEDGVEREKQLLIDFLCASAGGPMASPAAKIPGMLVSNRSSTCTWPRVLIASCRRSRPIPSKLATRPNAANIDQM